LSLFFYWFAVDAAVVAAAVVAVADAVVAVAVADAAILAANIHYRYKPKKAREISRAFLLLRDCVHTERSRPFPTEHCRLGVNTTGLFYKLFN
ncbi:MAG: hypothetical protein RSE07_07000, partial [Oscillospiraceae bacterium]